MQDPYVNPERDKSTWHNQGGECQIVAFHTAHAVILVYSSVVSFWVRYNECRAHLHGNIMRALLLRQVRVELWLGFLFAHILYWPRHNHFD